MDIRDHLQKVVANRGLVAFGVCDVAPFTDTRAELERRAANGLNAGMRFTYTDTETSTDVRTSFPWAHRLIVVAHGYLPESGPGSRFSPATGRIARFATENHYQPLRAALDEIALGLRTAGYSAEILVDDNRLVDRAAAVRAGIAWWGKSTMVLAPGVGPWLLLGSIVTDMEIPVDQPMIRDCGKCDACLPACPTGALISPGVLDARRCLAHLLQAPGVIPRALRSAVGDRIYGCDDCLDACPPGHRALESTKEAVPRPDLRELLATPDEDLRRLYAHFYLPRNDVRYLRRNALVALANSGDTGADAILAGYLGHPDWLLRLHAAWGLGERAGPLAGAALRSVRATEPHEDVRDEIDDALQRMAAPNGGASESC